MCGIAGFIGSEEQAVMSEEVCEGFGATLHHRGPDSFGYARFPGLTLLHWRLAVIDTSAAGEQPMYSHCGRYVVIYNGEIYNADEIRIELETELGSTPKWNGHSDTEVLIQGFAHWGENLFPKLNGMFAIAIYDVQEKHLWLARDRVGIKPLYLWTGKSTVQFCSEPKILFQSKDFKFSLSKEGLEAYLLYGHGYGEARVLRGLRQLEPGTVAELNLNGTEDERVLSKVSRYVECPRWEKRGWTLESAAKEIRRLIEKSVERQIVADVPVGVFLSGGVDSSILTAIASQIMGPKNTKAFTLGYKGYGGDFDEIDVASRTARHLGVEHFVLEAEERDLRENFEQMVWQFDEPFADGAALNVLILSRLVRKHVTVALAGEGSDELFGGYRRYRVERFIRRLGGLEKLLRPVFRCLGAFKFGLPRRFQILNRSLSRQSAGERYSAYFESSIDPSEIVCGKWKSEVNPRDGLATLYPGARGDDPIASMSLADQQFWLVDSYLEKSDKASMAYSLEIRVPFLDNEIIDFANSLPDDLRQRGGQGKRILRYAFRDILPEDLFTRFKRGFAVPCSRWLRSEMREYFEEKVFANDSRIKEYLMIDEIRKIASQHVSGREDHSSLLWRILVFETWLQLVERGFQRPVLSAERELKSKV